MVPRKRLKQDHKNMDVNNEAIDFEPPNIVEHLGTLPPEILEKIFKYLSPEHLVFIQHSGNSRVSEATVLKKADFSDSQTATDAFMNSFFTRIRNSSLQEIYLPQMLYIGGPTIFKYVSRCKFLTKLSISYRGLSYIKLLHILEKCKALKELNYYVFLNSKANYHLVKTTHNLKKICLNIVMPIMPNSSSVNIAICQDLLSRCETEAEVYLNFSYCTFTFNLEHKEAKRLITNLIVIVPNEYPIMGVPICFETLFRRLMSVNFSVEDFSHQKDDYRGFCVSLSKICPIFSKKKTSNVLSILPATPVQTLVLIDDCPNEELGRTFLHSLTEEVSLKSLKHLTVLNKFKTSTYVYENPGDIYRVQLTPLVLPDIFSKCSYLQEVVFSRIHFDESCPSLFSLKCLKTLKLPPCAISSNPFCHTLSASKHQRHFLEDLVENCKCIESFSLSFCSSVGCLRDTLTDDDLIHIHKWPNLKHLSLREIHKVRTCSFLPRVAADTKLTTLCLKDVGPLSVCHYSSNLCYAIKMASNLKFLMISQPVFNLSELRFWKHIGEAKTLEGLCIYSCLITQINTSWITNSIEKLKRLHLFHFMAPQYPECLKRNIKKAILGNGIQNPNIETNSLFDPSSSTSVHCICCHYPFIVPPYHHRI